jgi:hypothetical protein
MVEFPDGSARTERWDGKSWVPTSIDAASIGKAPPAGRAKLAALGIPTGSMSVSIVPSVVDGALVRGVKMPDGSGRLEVFNGSAWEPTKGFNFGEVVKAPPASPATLARFGVPTTS